MRMLLAFLQLGNLDVPHEGHLVEHAALSETVGPAHTVPHVTEALVCQGRGRQASLGLDLQRQVRVICRG